MKRLVYISCFLISAICMGQESFSETRAIQVIDTFFEGFHAGDTTQMRSVMAQEVTLQTAYTDKEGNHQLSTEKLEKLLNAIANRPDDQKWDEKLLDYKVQIDGNLAHVWTPYEFWFNGQLSHCGANAFTLAKTNEGWKIIHLIDSRRRSNCK